MRRLAVLGCLSLSLFACRAHEAQSQKLNDGTWKFSCSLPMEDCIRQAEKTCRSQRYRILEGTSETRVNDVPPLETTYYTSRLHLLCDPPAAGVAPAPAAPGVTSSAPHVAPPQGACVKGETRECVGAAACRGGQMCLPDGSGFGPCDCGASSSAPAAPSPPSPEPPPSLTSP